MKPLTIVLFTLLFLIFTGTLLGQDLEKLRDPDGKPLTFTDGWKPLKIVEKDNVVSKVYSYRPDKIEKLGPGIYKATVKLKDHNAGLDLMTYEFSCSFDKLRLTKLSHIRKGGLIPDQTEPNETFSPAAPKSIDEIILTTICKEARR